MESKRIQSATSKIKSNGKVSSFTKIAKRMGWGILPAMANRTSAQTLKKRNSQETRADSA